MRRARLLLITAGFVVIFGLPATSYPGGWSIVDRRVHEDDSGIWNHNIYSTMMGVLSLADLGGALWEGSESRLGRTLWRTMDSQILAVGSAAAMKYAFTRQRPSDTGNPNNWFAHGSDPGFPSVESALSASLVTPFVLEYAGEHPAAYGLLLMPLYVGVGRIKNREHWQTDVLAGWAVGGLSGWLSHRRNTPLIVQVLPHGGFVGLKTRF